MSAKNPTKSQADEPPRIVGVFDTRHPDEARAFGWIVKTPWRLAALCPT